MILYVNKEIGLANNFKPSMLIDVKSKYKKNVLLEGETYKHWFKLQKDLRRKNCIIEIASGYRSYEYQKRILDELIFSKGEKYANNAIAKPGHSEHQTGLALDYCIYKNKKFLIEHDIADLDECMYINSIAYLYGFIVRYPKEKEGITGYQYEPWHLRYVGLELAKYLVDNDLTLDEYYKKERLND